MFKFYKRQKKASQYVSKSDKTQSL
ncbi:MAG: hypothetical protein JWQ14_3281, partial [Adhaeribacter sp.]|nr:hypothetical protein [Adhaeribacter sp.]